MARPFSLNFIDRNPLFQRTDHHALGH